MMINSLSNGARAVVNWSKESKIQRTERTAENAITDAFIERVKEYAKEDAKQGVYMSGDFIQMRLAYMKQNISPDRSGPKAEVMSAIQAALKEPNPLLQSLEIMLSKLSGGGSAKLQICSIQQTAEIYAPNGENIASYNSLGRGWTDIQIKEEHRYFSETAMIYLQAFREARAEMNAVTQDRVSQDSTSTVDVQA